VVAGTFDYRSGTGIAHRETLAGHAVEERFAGDRAVQHGVADDDVVDCTAAELGVRAHDDASAGKSLADVIVAAAHQIQRDAVREE
jgi:hypothetical protein